MPSLISFSYYEGLAFDLVWQNSPQLNDGSISLFFRSIAIVFAMLFSMKFLFTKQFVPIIHRILLYLMAFFILISVLIIAGVSKIEGLFYPTILLIFGLLWFTAINIFILGYKPARFYVIAWSCYILGAAATIFTLLNILPSHTLLPDGYSIGALCEATLLSIALADRMNIFKKEMKGAQDLAIKRLAENEKYLSEQNQHLLNRFESPDSQPPQMNDLQDLLKIIRAENEKIKKIFVPIMESVLLFQ